MDKTEDYNKLLQDVTDFCYASLEWCVEESEDAISNAHDILKILLVEASRVSAVSKETLDAIESMREMIDSLSGKGDRGMANELAFAVKETASQDEEIEAFAKPVIMTLQFQDRISQNIGNFCKMLDLWVKHRKELAAFENVELNDYLKNFGTILLKNTTMEKEREVVRTYIKGLKKEDKISTNVLFF